jgi:hypothetical protein
LITSAIATSIIEPVETRKIPRELLLIAAQRARKRLSRSGKSGDPVWAGHAVTIAATAKATGLHRGYSIAVIPGHARKRVNPESILPVVVMDSGFARHSASKTRVTRLWLAPRNDENSLSPLSRESAH